MVESPARPEQRARRPFYIRIASLAVSFSFLFCSCSFLTWDIFPSWLSYSDASFDLRAEIRDFSEGDLDDPESYYVEYLQTIGGKAYIAVLLFYNSQGRLVILDPDDMIPIATIVSTDFSPFLAAGSGGDIVCGQVSIDTTSYTDSGVGPSSLGYGSRQWLVRNGPYSEQYVVGCDGAYLFSKRKDNSTWSASSSPVDSAVAITPYPMTGWNLIDGETAVTGSGANLLFSYSGGSNQVGYSAYYASTNIIEGITEIIGDSATKITGPFRLDDGMAWITSGGPVAYVRSDNGRNKLVRYKFGTGDVLTDTYSTELDSFAMDTNDMDILSFDPAGNFWFVYERDSGRLLKLRTWWK